MTIVLFQLVGAKRTRFIAQVVAAIVGAGFVIGVQARCDHGYGNMSRFAAFHSDCADEPRPRPRQPRLVAGARCHGRHAGPRRCLLVASSCSAPRRLRLVAAASRSIAIAAAGVAAGAAVRRAGRAAFRPARAPALRRKEWTLLRARSLAAVADADADPLPHPAGACCSGATTATESRRACRARSGAGDGRGPARGRPRLARHLRRGRARSRRDGADRAGGAILRAKIEAVLGVGRVRLSPLVFAVAIVSPWTAVVTIVGMLIAAASSTAIQMFFRAQAKRSHFRRRQTSSRVATFAEAFSSIGWAGAAGLAAAGNGAALLVALLAVLVVFIARMFRPRHALA